MNTRFVIGFAAASFCFCARAQIADSEPDAVANIPVNYTEAKAGAYMLPDPLKFADGSPVAEGQSFFIAEVRKCGEMDAAAAGRRPARLRARIGAPARWCALPAAPASGLTYGYISV